MESSIHASDYDLTRTPEIDTVCTQLDETTDGILTTLGAILRYQTQLEDHMKNGYLLMAKARYNMGVNRVGALQYNEDDLKEASFKITVKPISELNESEVFTKDTGDGEDIPIESETELRQRKPKSSVTDLSSRIEDIKIDNSVKSEHCDGKNNSQNGSRTKSNPLKWFGVLVPRALRQSQTSFGRALDQCCHIANLKCKLVQLRNRHKDLMEKKFKLIGIKRSENKCDNSGESSDSYDKVSDIEDKEIHD